MCVETLEIVVEKDAIFDAFVHEGSDHVVGNPKQSWRIDDMNLSVP